MTLLSQYFIAVAPLRLMAIKNGIRDITKAMAVVGPDLTNVSANISVMSQCCACQESLVICDLIGFKFLCRRKIYSTRFEL